MTQNQDAFGKYLLAQYEADLRGDLVVAEIVERDDSFIDFGSISRMYFSEYAEWSELERRMIDMAKGKVLDIGCGAGRHSLYLQSKGLEVTGIDRSPGAIEVCRSRGLENAILRPIDEIEKFEANTFDSVVMFGNNFGLLGGKKSAKLILEKMHRITTRAAKIIAKTMNPHMTDNEAHQKYQARNIELGRLPGEIRLRIRYYGFIGEWFDYLFVSPEEMEMVLKDTGWKIDQLINEEESNYFAVIGKKPGA